MAGENFSQDGESYHVFHVFTAGGKTPGEPSLWISFIFHSVLRRFWVVFRSRFVGWFCLTAIKKPPDGGRSALMQDGVSEAHHTGDGPQIGIEVGVEGRVVVADGAVGILEAVSGQNADHR